MVKPKVAFMTRIPDDMLYESSRLDQDYEPVAVVRETGDRDMGVELRTVCHRGEEVEYMGRGIGSDRFQVETMQDGQGREVERANPGDLLRWRLRGKARAFSVNSMFRRKKSGPGRS